MNNSSLKAQAKDRIKHAKPSPLLVGLIFVVISALIAFLSFKLVGEPRQELILRYIDLENITYEKYVELINSPSFLREFAALQSDTAPRLLNLLLKLMSLFIGVGLTVFSLNTLRNRNASCWNLFDGFSVFFRVIILYLLEALFVFLWAMLFVIPGLIAYYRYSQAIYLLLDHPEMSPLQCISESKRLMKGHKGERFGLDVSFIGWLLLISLADTLGAMAGISFMGYIIGIFFYPFYHLTAAAYYRRLTNDDLPDLDGWVPEV